MHQTRMTEAELILAIEKLDDAARKRVLDWAESRWPRAEAQTPLPLPLYIPMPCPVPAPQPYPWQPWQTTVITYDGVAARLPFGGGGTWQ